MKIKELGTVNGGIATPVQQILIDEVTYELEDTLLQSEKNYSFAFPPASKGHKSWARGRSTPPWSDLYHPVVNVRFIIAPIHWTISVNFRQTTDVVKFRLLVNKLWSVKDELQYFIPSVERSCEDTQDWREFGSRLPQLFLLTFVGVFFFKLSLICSSIVY